MKKMIFSAIIASFMTTFSVSAFDNAIATIPSTNCEKIGVGITIITMKNSTPGALLFSLKNNPEFVSCNFVIQNAQNPNETCGISYEGKFKRMGGFLEDATQYNEKNCNWFGPSTAYVECTVGRKKCAYSEEIVIEDCCC